MHADWHRHLERRGGPDQPSTPSTRPTEEGLRILVVASDPVAVASLTSLLQRFGHRVQPIDSPKSKLSGMWHQ
jgi:hypothetical protein